MIAGAATSDRESQAQHLLSLDSSQDRPIRFVSNAGPINFHSMVEVND